MANRQRGLLKIVDEVQQAHVDPNAADVKLPSTGAAEAFGAIATGFGQIGERIGKLADHAAQIEGAEAGQLAGLDPEFRTTRSLTIRGEAFDRAGLETWMARSKVAISEDLEGAWDKHQANPAALNQAIAEKRAGWLAQAPQEVRPEIEILFAKSQQAYSRQATRQQAARVIAEQKSSLDLEVADTLKGIQQRAALLGLDADADQILADDVKRLETTLGRRGVNGQPLIAPGDAKKLIAGAKEEVTTSRLMGAFDRLPSLEAKAKFITDLETEWKESRGLAQVYDLAGIRKVTGMLASELRAARTEQNAASRGLAEDVRGVATMAAKGFGMSDSDMAALKARVASAGKPDLAQDLANAESLLQWQRQARRWTPAELDTWARSERARITDKATPAEVARLELGDKLHDTMVRELKEDPLGWADRVGLLKVAPLDFSSPDAAAATLRARVAQADEVAAGYGIRAKYLRPDEARSLAAATAQGGANAIALAQSIVGAVPDRATEMLAQVFDHAPTVAVLGGLVASTDPSRPPAIARDAADGLALRKTPDFKTLVPDGRKARTAAGEVLGTALAALPKSETAIVAVANSAYEVRARRQGVTEFDADLYKQVLREALGERTIDGVIYGGLYWQDKGWLGGNAGAPIVVPAEVKRDRFGELIETVRPGDLMDAFGDGPRDRHGKLLSMASIRRSRLVTIGNGLYQMALGSDLATDPQWIERRTGEPYVLDLNAMLPTLRRRRPDLFVTGER